VLGLVVAPVCVSMLPLPTLPWLFEVGAAGSEPVVLDVDAVLVSVEVVPVEAEALLSGVLLAGALEVVPAAAAVFWSAEPVLEVADWQLSETIATLVTLSVGWLGAPLEAALESELAALCVPVAWIMWPTWSFSMASSPAIL